MNPPATKEVRTANLNRIQGAETADLAKVKM